MKAAREWLARGSTGHDDFETFTNYWFAFNGLFGDAAGRTEQDRIKQCVADRVTREQAVRILETRRPQITYLLARPVVDQKRPNRNTSEHIRRFRASDNPVEQLGALLLVIYQVRCNLFHGSKAPTRPRDSALCRSAAPIIGDLVKTLIQPSRKTS